MNKILFLAPILALVAMPLTANATGYLHFKPDSKAIVPANHFLTVNGTSAPSNSTHTRCDVKLQTNQHGYQPVTPKALGDYTKWSTITSEMMKVGNNTLEGQIECFPAVGATPNFIHHLVHNITAVG